LVQASILFKLFFFATEVQRDPVLLANPTQHRNSWETNTTNYFAAP